ncbi:hypothetical protein [Corynebacterium casei]|uniref:hypothetical protein n=1 Tax=Corynebacterium casei TaxID=160386 RepID=UPI003F9147D1
MVEDSKKKFWQRSNDADSDLNRPATDEEKNIVAAQIEQTKEFVSGLGIDDLKNGDWFPRLLTFAVANYADNVDAEYFRKKYPDLPVDAIVDQRIRMAARYASIEGTISASAYTAAIAGTIGTLGGASPFTVSAGAASFSLDMIYTTQLQLRTAYDISVLYGVPINMDDPDDMWKLVKIAFAIKAGETGTIAISKGIPEFARVIVRKYFSGSVLAAARSFPVIGKYLLQRNVIKFAIPAIGVPVTTVVNFWTTKLAGTHAKKVLRREVKIAEAANRAVANTTDQGTLLWVFWLVMRSDAALNEDETLLYHYVSKSIRGTGQFEAELSEIQSSVVLDDEKAWSIIAASKEPGHLLYRAGLLASAVDGKMTSEKLKTLKKLAETINVDFSEKEAGAYARKWAQD